MYLRLSNLYVIPPGETEQLCATLTINRNRKDDLSAQSVSHPSDIPSLSPGLRLLRTVRALTSVLRTDSVREDAGIPRVVQGDIVPGMVGWYSTGHGREAHYPHMVGRPTTRTWWTLLPAHGGPSYPHMVYSLYPHMVYSPLPAHGVRYTHPGKDERYPPGQG